MERLLEAGIEPSVGGVGNSYDNALAETIIGLFKTEVIRRRGPWRSLEVVEYASLDWVDCYNTRRLLEPIGNMPPAKAEARYSAQLKAPTLRSESSQIVSGEPGAVHDYPADAVWQEAPVPGPAGRERDVNVVPSAAAANGAPLNPLPPSRSP